MISSLSLEVEKVENISFRTMTNTITVAFYCDFGAIYLHTQYVIYMYALSQMD